jgi:hypothetical protein
VWRNFSRSYDWFQRKGVLLSVTHHEEKEILISNVCLGGKYGSRRNSEGDMLLLKPFQSPSVESIWHVKVLDSRVLFLIQKVKRIFAMFEKWPSVLFSSDTNWVT